MQTPHFITRWSISLLLAFGATAYSQSNYLFDGLGPVRTVTEGKSITFSAQGARGSVQWQVSADGGRTWSNLAENDVYRGATATNLEIVNATAALTSLKYRYRDTVDGVTNASDGFALNVAPLIFAMSVGIQVNADGSLFVSDAADHTVRVVGNAVLDGWGNDAPCPVALVAGDSGQAGYADGIGSDAQFAQPGGLVLAESGDLLVADTANGAIRQIKATIVTTPARDQPLVVGTLIVTDGRVTTLAGGSTERGNVDGVAYEARFSTPVGIARAPDGSYYVADSTNHTIRKVTADGTVSTFAGSAGMAGSADGAGQAARFNNPTGVAVDGSGNVYVSDTANNLIRKISPTTVVTTLAGVAGAAGAQDGPGGSALFNGPTGIAVSPDGYLYVADTGNSTIRTVSPSGVVSAFAGVTGVAGLRDALAQYDPYGYPDALFNHPRALALGAGQLFVADTGNAAIRVMEYYNGVSMTLPLHRQETAPSAPAPVTPNPPATPAPPTSVPPSAASSGGGGAPSAWFLLALAGAWLVRRLTIRRSAAADRAA